MSASSNEVPSNGVPSNEVSSNGVPSNEVSSNGVPSNEVSSDRVKELSIVFFQSIPGTGKSYLMENLAKKMRDDNYRVIIIYADGVKGWASGSPLRASNGSDSTNSTTNTSKTLASHIDTSGTGTFFFIDINACDVGQKINNVIKLKLRQNIGLNIGLNFFVFRNKSIDSEYIIDFAVSSIMKRGDHASLSSHLGEPKIREIVSNFVGFYKQNPWEDPYEFNNLDTDKNNKIIGFMSDEAFDEEVIRVKHVLCTMKPSIKHHVSNLPKGKAPSQTKGKAPYQATTSIQAKGKAPSQAKGKAPSQADGWIKAKDRAPSQAQAPTSIQAKINTSHRSKPVQHRLKLTDRAISMMIEKGLPVDPKKEYHFTVFYQKNANDIPDSKYIDQFKDLTKIDITHMINEDDWVILINSEFKQINGNPFHITIKVPNGKKPVDAGFKARELLDNNSLPTLSPMLEIEVTYVIV
jgi:hypothetical protein